MLVKLRFSFHILMIVLLLVTETIFLPVSHFLLLVWVLKGFELQEGRASVHTHTHTLRLRLQLRTSPISDEKEPTGEKKNLIVTFCQGKQIRQYMPSEIYEHIWSKIWVATISLLASQTAFCQSVLPIYILQITAILWQWSVFQLVKLIFVQRVYFDIKYGTQGWLIFFCLKITH